MLFKVDTHNCLTVKANSNIMDLINSKIIELKSIDESSNKLALKPYLFLQPERKINDTIYLKLIFFKNDEFVFEVEKHFNESYKKYRYMTKYKEEVLNIIYRYMVYKETPELDKWIDVTHEIESMANLNKLFGMSDEDIESDLLKYFNENSQKNIGKGVIAYGTYELSRMYLYNKGIKNVFFYDFELNNKSRLHLIMNKVIFIYQSKLTNHIMSFVDECVKWKSSKKKITKNEVCQFFKEKELFVPADILDTFYRKVNTKNKDSDL